MFPILLHSLRRLTTPKHFPFKPHQPHPHMALSTLLNKQFSEPLTTTALKPVLTVSCGIISCFLKSAAICQSLPALGANTTRLPRKASPLHFSSLMDKTNCNTFLPIDRWSNFNQLLSHAVKALTVVMSRGVSGLFYTLAKCFKTLASKHMGNWHFGKMLAKQLVHMIDLSWFGSRLFDSLQLFFYIFLIHPQCQLCYNSLPCADVLPYNHFFYLTDWLNP